jgi:beta-galactosidase
VLLDPPGRVRIWTERIRADDAEVVASYASGDLAGLPAVTRARRGAGTATYVSTHLDRERAGHLVDDLVGRAGVAPVAVGETGLELVRRVGVDTSWLFAINHTDRDRRLDVDGLDLVTGARHTAGATVAAGAVAVIREDAR